MSGFLITYSPKHSGILRATQELPRRSWLCFADFPQLGSFCRFASRGFGRPICLGGFVVALLPIGFVLPKWTRASANPNIVLVSHCLTALGSETVRHLVAHFLASDDRTTASVFEMI